MSAARSSKVRNDNFAHHPAGGSCLLDISAARKKSPAKPVANVDPGYLAITRRFDDGTVEFEDWRGGIRRGKIIRCQECERDLPDFGFTISFTTNEAICNDCIRAERGLRDEELKRQEDDAYRRRLISQLGNAVRRRAALLSCAKVAWRDLGKIRAVYEEARRLTRETGIPHHVDHFYPLQGQFCCGLHVHENMQVLPFDENISKNNGHPMVESPALAAMLKEYGRHGLLTWLRWAQKQIS